MSLDHPSLQTNKIKINPTNPSPMAKEKLYFVFFSFLREKRCVKQSGYSSIKAGEKSEAHDARTRKMDAIQGRAKTCKQILMTDLQAADHVSTSRASCMFGSYVPFLKCFFLDTQNCTFEKQLLTIPFSFLTKARRDFYGDRVEIHISFILPASLEHIHRHHRRCRRCHHSYHHHHQNHHHHNHPHCHSDSYSDLISPTSIT